MSPSQMEDVQHEVQDPLEEINLGEFEDPKVVYVRLDKKLVEHRLPLKDGFKPFQQPSRHISKEVELKVKEVVKKLLRATFIKPIRYTEWLSNIMPVMKKNGKVRICIDFRDLNCATPKDVGVEVDKNKAKAIMEPNPPRNKKELKRFLGEVNYLRHFISNLLEKTKEFSQLLKLKDSGEFKWEDSYQKAFDVIKRYLSNSPVLMPPRVFVVTKTDLIKYMLNRPILSGRIVKGQAIADFLADHPSLDEFIGEQVGFPVCGVEVRPGELKFDGSSIETTVGACIVITSPKGVKTTLSFNLGFPCTDNKAEYAQITGLEILKDLGAKELLISGDSQLVLKHLLGEFKCTRLSLAPYYTAVSQFLDDFEEVFLIHVPRQENWEADELAHVASGLKMPPELTHRLVLIQKKNHPSIQQRGIQVDMLNLDINLASDWRDDIKQVLESTVRDIPHGLKMKALNYVLVEGDLYRKGLDGLLLRCIGFPEALETMKHVHEGVCGAHQSRVKMRWLIRRYG
ncbi:uncharacterized protein LOC142537705 [Primulina tabacum]|uniref:uncharacterized protein LOC142537705 n=1 Tax=Primulina tabacum TaxID=48773 RepID=UPI003F5915A3